MNQPEEDPMPASEKDSNRPAINVRVESEKAPRFNVGTRWEVVASSLGSLWEGAYTVTFREIEVDDRSCAI
jgi:hypothetical protein